MNIASPVLCTTKDTLTKANIPTTGKHLIPVSLDTLKSFPMHFIAKAVLDSDVMIGQNYPQITPYVCITKLNQVLSYTKPQTNQLSVGFGSVIHYEHQQDSLPNTVLHTIVQDLQHKLGISIDEPLEFTPTVMLIVDNDNDDGKTHLGLLFCFESDTQSFNTDDSIVNPKWQYIKRLTNKKDDYQPWSQLVIDFLVSM
ncbi:hypothetical protein ACFBZI_10620 [Moraxella sp. ZJ142]|uniref:hypothetical protein n=1 Tax=Moraxella marmotae TaxID=3344520 RepID=UPI0035D4B9DE